MSNLEKYQQLFMEIFQVEQEKLNENFTYTNMEEWDSITHMSLIASLEDEFAIMLDTSEILHYGSYENGISILKNHGVQI